MSMYTQLLDAALRQRAPVLVCLSERSALDAVRRCRGQLADDQPSGPDPDAVSTVLAREIAYDVALLELADVLGIDTELERFAQPRLERARLEQALRDHGVSLAATDDVPEPAPRRA
jgi:hypothetical protein